MIPDQPRDAATAKANKIIFSANDVIAKIDDPGDGFTEHELRAMARSSANDARHMASDVIDLIARATAAEAEVRDMAESAARTQETYERVLDEAEAGRRKAEAALAEARLNEEMADGCLDMVRGKLVQIGVPMEHCPPMMYPEAIQKAMLIVTEKLRERGEALARALHIELCDCDCPIQEPGKHWSSCESAHAAFAAWREIVPAPQAPEKEKES